MIMDLQAILDVFYSNFSGIPDYQGLQTVLDLLDKNYLSITKIKTDISKNIYQKTTNDILTGRIKSIDYQGGSNNHLALKVLSERYIRNNFGLQSNLEYSFFGRVPDVISRDKNIIFECGDTDPWKISEYFRHNEDLIVFILPYPLVEDTFLYTYKFLKNKPGLQNYLYQQQVDSLADVKKIITGK